MSLTSVLSPSRRRQETSPAFLPASSLVKLLLRTVKTNCRTAAKSFRTLRPPATLRPPPPCPRRTSSQIPVSKAVPATPEARSNEHFSAVYRTAGRDHAPYGGRPTRGFCCVSSVASFCAAAGGLPNNPNSDLLSRREPRGHGFERYGSARAPVRPNSRPAADDFHQLFRQLAHHPTI